MIVGQISDETLSYASSSNRSLALRIQEFLDTRAQDISDLGYNVVRIPMPVPSADLYRSYTNSLLLNGTAIIPQYVSNRGSSYPDQQLLKSYESQVVALMNRLVIKLFLFLAIA